MKTPALLCSVVLLASCERYAPSEGIVADDPTPALETQGANEALPPDSTRWAEGELVPIARSTRDCEARRNGRFVRIACNDISANLIEQLAGDAAGVRFAIKTDKVKPFATHSFVVLPLVEGDKRVVQFAHVAASRWEWGASAESVISAYWIRGDAAPTIVIE